jgi:putative transposase
LLTALAYVDLNPLRAGLVGQAEQYEWSSARGHAVGVESDPTIDAWAWSELALGDDWTTVLEEAAASNDGERLRQSTYAGLPFGDAALVGELERCAGRPLRHKPPGPTPQADRAAAGG